MKNTSLVSCIIPSYRGEKYLWDAIESFLKQDYSNKEIIVVIEFFSWDNSYELYKEKYSHISFIKFYIFHEKMTPAKARNLWIELSSWKYICVLDDDDYLLGHTHISSAIYFLEENTNYWYISFCWEMLLRNKFFKYRWLNSIHRLDKFNFTHSWTIFHKDLLLKIHSYNANLRFFEDLDLFLRLDHLTKIRVLPQIVIKRFNANSISNRYTAFWELCFWLKVTTSVRAKYPWFYFGLFKKIIKCLLPKKIEMYFFRILVRFSSFFVPWK